MIVQPQNFPDTAFLPEMVSQLAGIPVSALAMVCTVGTGDYAAVAADWESGSIAWTARRNNTACVILRGVSDIVSQKGGEIYETGEFHHRAEEIMFALLQALPDWIRCTSARMDSTL